MSAVVIAEPASAEPVKGTWLRPVPGMSTRAFYLRCLWIVVRLAAAYVLANEASPFFYQQF